MAKGGLDNWKLEQESRDFKAEMRLIELELYPLSPELSGRPVEYLLRVIRRLKQVEKDAAP